MKDPSACPTDVRQRDTRGIWHGSLDPELYYAIADANFSNLDKFKIVYFNAVCGGSQEDCDFCMAQPAQIFNLCKWCPESGVCTSIYDKSCSDILESKMMNSSESTTEYNREQMTTEERPQTLPKESVVGRRLPYPYQLWDDGAMMPGIGMEVCHAANAKSNIHWGAFACYNDYNDKCHTCVEDVTCSWCATQHVDAAIDNLLKLPGALANAEENGGLCLSLAASEFICKNPVMAEGRNECPNILSTVELEKLTFASRKKKLLCSLFVIIPFACVLIGLGALHVAAWIWPRSIRQKSRSKRQ